jgi:ATP-dependent Lon protease
MQIKHNAETLTINSPLPVIPLRDIVVFPHMVYPLLVGRKFTLKALQEAMTHDKQILLVAQRSAQIDNPRAEDLHPVGVVARALQVMNMPNGTLKVLVEGVVRAKIDKVTKVGGFLTGEFTPIIREDHAADRESEALARAVSEQFAEYVRLNRRIPDDILVSVASIESHGNLADTIAAHLLHKIEIKQRILSADSLNEQFRILAEILGDEIEILKIEQKIEGSVRETMSKDQRQMYLQQQLKAIKEELGQGEDATAEVEELYAKLENGDYPKRVREKADEEIKKLSKMHPYSAEAGVIRSYLEWLLVLPWNVTTKERVDFKSVKAILDGDHYGLEKAKGRILEHLAVIRLAGKVKGPILCLVGPPGVGKTSVGRSVARAMGRKFVRMSLGGIHDEAEVRGHRRTYIGALPGRILQSMKKAGSSNPVFLLDEIDKIGSDFRGDPAAALLEVLDPEQNNSFADNYIEVEYDLSKTLFITTANSIQSIPIPLRDRMEIIRLPGYLDFEKAAIAKEYLWPKLQKDIGLGDIKIQLKEPALYELIRFYTRESGVRELERQLSSLLRKTAVEVAGGKKLRKVVITAKSIQKSLGPRKFTDTNLRTEPKAGYAIGLAWTEMGGEVLPVEVVPLKGKAVLTFTGSLGDVMKESGTAAMSYIRNHAQRFGLKEDFFETLELHVHVPEGAVPKDGPSAGITLAMAILSSLTKIGVRTDIAMTGEITLFGDVLAIGGLNEKLLAAKRLGITRIILPEKNRKDIVELQPELLEGLTLYHVESLTEAIKLAMIRSPFVKTKARPGQRPAAGMS